MRAEFWDERYADERFAYGTEPTPFVRREAARLPADAEVVELGAGEGRNASWLAETGRRVTLVDYSETGLAKARRLAEERGVSIECILADVNDWRPDRTWAGVVVTYLHLPPDQRSAFYGLIQRLTRPGGILIAEWFRPEQITGGYTSGGPPRIELMVSADELREHFPAEGIRYLEESVDELNEGPFHRGPAAVVRLVWQKPASQKSD